MRSLRITLLSLVLSLSTTQAWPAGDTPDAAATLPLSEVLRLYRESDAKQTAAPAAPPLAGSVHSLELSGRLLEGGLDVTAAVELSVLSSDAWVAVKLFRLDPRLHLTSLPNVEGGVLSVVEGSLCFVTDRSGRYAFELGMLLDATADGASRAVEIGYDQAALALLRLRYNALLFDVATAKGSGQEPGSAVVYPERGEGGGRFKVGWRQSEALSAAPEVEAAARPPVEPVIPSAHADVVSTLDGRTVVRMLYELRLEGRQGLDITLPEGYTLERAFQNGAAVAAAADERKLALVAAPSRAGDDTARIELVLAAPPIRYLLSGRLEYAFPALSWSVHELQVTLHLPQVFDYSWSAGSLGVASEGAAPATYTLGMPTPGKEVALHQDLVSAAPWVRVAYTVDLEGSYFDGPAAVACLQHGP